MQGGAQVIKGGDLGSWSGSAGDTPGMIFPSQGMCIPGDGELHWRNPEKLQVRWSTGLARDSACRRCQRGPLSEQSRFAQAALCTAEVGFVSSSVLQGL